MKAQFQTENTGCLQAAVASLLEYELEDVPNFALAKPRTEGVEPHWEALQTWLNDQELWFLEVSLPANFPWFPVLYTAECIMFGPLAGGSRHAIVGRLQGDKMLPWHDPLPGSGGLVALDALGFILPKSPAMPCKFGSGLLNIMSICAGVTGHPVVRDIRAVCEEALGLERRAIIRPGENNSTP